MRKIPDFQMSGIPGLRSRKLHIEHGDLHLDLGMNSYIGCHGMQIGSLLIDLSIWEYAIKNGSDPMRNGL